MRETNAQDSILAVHYEEYLRSFVQNTRQDVQNDQLPFFAATLADFLAWPFKSQINAEIRAAANKLPGLYVVSTADLSGKPDSVHFDAPGQREMGMRFTLVAGSLLH